MTADLLAILDLGTTDDGFLDHVRRFADARDAHLRVCVTAPVRSLEYSLALEGGYPLTDELGKDVHDKASHVAAALKREVADADVIALHGEPTDMMKALTRQARTVDLTVIGPPEAYAGRAFRKRTAEVLALTSGRPVMLMSRRGVPDRIGHLVIGWNDSREAVRALHDALPLLELDARIDVVSVGASGGAVDLKAICAHLGRMGHEPAPHWLTGKGDAGDLLLRFARERHADLLAAGAYGHARIGEFILGGVTRDLLDGGAVSILLSH